MTSFAASPLGMLRSFSANASLIGALTLREVQRSYRGSYLGVLWLVAQPLALLSVYAFVFGYVLQARFGTEGESELSYALSLFAGLMLFNVFSECLTRSPSLIVSNTNYVKKIVFPLEVLSLAILGAALFRALLSFFVWLIFYGIVYGMPKATILFVPLVFLPLSAFSLGISWILSSLGVYVRDLTQIVSVLATATLFLSAIFYPVSRIPDPYRTYMYLNPMTSIVEQMRLVAIHGQFPSAISYLTLAGASLAFLAVAFWWFQVMRRGFSDVL